MVRQRKRNRFSSKKCKTFSFDKIMADVVKSIKDVKEFSPLIFLNQFSNGWWMPLNVKKITTTWLNFQRRINVVSALWINIKITLMRRSE